jgi:uncharacterized membrane protein SpoIIM required for sporulation
MKVSDLLESRQANWGELERVCAWMEGRSRRKIPGPAVARFSALYRAACADLALADAYQLPATTIHYLHQLVGRAHNQLYRAQSFRLNTWLPQLFAEVPQRLFADNCLRLAFGVFWGVFLLSFVLAYHSPRYAKEIIGKEGMMQLEDSFSQPIGSRTEGLPAGDLPAGFYIIHNAGIGLRVFAFGLLFGIGGLYITLVNAAQLGASFGYMATSPHRDHFFNFVTAHAPFELTAIVLSAAAGMRLGFSIVSTRGYTRTASLQRAGKETLPIMMAAVLMFALAALIEGFLSPSDAPYGIKLAVAVGSCAMLMVYFVILGFPRED